MNDGTTRNTSRRTANSTPPNVRIDALNQPIICSLTQKIALNSMVMSEMNDIERVSYKFIINTREAIIRLSRVMFIYYHHLQNSAAKNQRHTSRLMVLYDRRPLLHSTVAQFVVFGNWQSGRGSQTSHYLLICSHFSSFDTSVHDGYVSAA